MDFLGDVRAARENGVSIEVYAYDRKRDGSQQGAERELIMFENVNAYLSANQADRFVIVTGRVHARKSLVFDGGVRSLANQLSDVQRITSLDMVAKKGSYWVCFAHPVKTFDCGVKEVQNKKGAAAQYQHGEGVYLFSKASPDYDGELYFDSVRFSPPVQTSAQ
ncbi:hypothetical protein [Pseudoalteromonas sp. T1lg48]|uniref:hypothetical protein n=1 Tax=Pseudoalteromonas sp. T1lg48 TaxID=2077100 RepID=UPI00131A1EE5|nr:hypothetical protein [Pseudoalteromonas sp. T1lg48]